MQPVPRTEGWQGPRSRALAVKRTPRQRKGARIAPRARFASIQAERPRVRPRERRHSPHVPASLASGPKITRRNSRARQRVAHEHGTLASRPRILTQLRRPGSCDWRAGLRGWRGAGLRGLRARDCEGGVAQGCEPGGSTHPGGCAVASPVDGVSWLRHQWWLRTRGTLRCPGVASGIYG